MCHKHESESMLMYKNKNKSNSQILAKRGVQRKTVYEMSSMSPDEGK